MPGVSPPNGEQYYADLGRLFQRVRALETQQQSTITNQLGQPVLNFGLVPGSNPARYGLQFVDPVSGTEQMFLGESSTGTALTIVLEGNGSVTVKDSETGGTIAVIGALPSAYNRADGSAQPGVVFYREDGSLAAVLADLNPTTPPYKQSWQNIDRSNNIIFADDTNGGVGLARPYLPAGTFQSISPPTDTTTSGTFTGLAWADVYQQHPKITASVLVQTSAGTTGNVRMTVGGVQVCSTLSVGAGVFQQYTLGAGGWPTGTYAFEQRVTVQLEACVTGGTGSIGVRALGLWGVQS